MEEMEKGALYSQLVPLKHVPVHYRGSSRIVGEEHPVNQLCLLLFIWFCNLYYKSLRSLHCTFLLFPITSTFLTPVSVLSLG